MANTLVYPEVVGTLSPDEAAAFSQDFTADLDVIPRHQQLYSADDVRLFDGDTERAGIHLPVTHAQFLPAVRVAVEHERTVRGGQQLVEAVLTARQTVVQPGQAQQGGNGTFVHRDNPYADNFYTVSDTNPTIYHPDIVRAPNSSSFIDLSREVNYVGDSIAFNPFDIVWSSTNVFHHSPPVAVPTRRTFLRLSFYYDHSRRW